MNYGFFFNKTKKLYKNYTKLLNKNSFSVFQFFNQNKVFKKTIKKLEKKSNLHLVKLSHEPAS